MTYIYVRRDLSYMAPQAQALLKAFLMTLYDDDYITHCVTTYKFARVSGIAKDIALAGINSLEIDPNATEFKFETAEDTLLYEGQGLYWISGKRSSSMAVAVDRLTVANDDLTKRVVMLEKMLKETMGQMGGIISNNDGSSHSLTIGEAENAMLSQQNDKNAEIAASLALSIISIIFSFIVLMWLGYRSCAGTHEDVGKVNSGVEHT